MAVAKHLASPSVTFGVSIFCRVPGTLPLHKRKGILLPPGAFRGAFQKNDTCFPLFCCVCDLWTSVPFARVHGEVPRELPGAREIPKRKMTLWKWHLHALENTTIFSARALLVRKGPLGIFFPASHREGRRQGVELLKDLHTGTGFLRTLCPFLRSHTPILKKPPASRSSY